MFFFTDITTNASNFCLLHINKYNDKRKLTKKTVFVDPGVHYLLKHKEYPHIDILHDLASGRKKMMRNEYISIDYPGDMFPDRMDEFIEKTYQNNILYVDNPQYICTIQFHLSNCAEPRKNLVWSGSAQGALSDFDSFEFNFNRISHILNNPKKILGIGNICRIMYPNELTDQIISFLINNIDKIKSKRIHFYGLAMRLIKKYIKPLENAGFSVSIDSTKWTKAVTKELKLVNGVCCRKHNRDLFFETYMDEIRKVGVDVIS